MRKNKSAFRKTIALFMLFLHTGQVFASSLILDPSSKHNTKLDKSGTGVPIVNVATPSNRGISINEFLEYNIDKEGQVLNNADNIGRSHLAGLINGNPNFKANQAANLIVLQVNGSNRSQIEGYLEALSRKKVDVVLSNENGIYINNSGTINIKNFTATTGKIKLQDGDYVGVDVEKGLIAIGPRGMDLKNTNYVEILSKTLEVAGKVVTDGDLKVVAGSNKITKDGTVQKIDGANSQVAIDATNLGGMYANTIRIISTDKGAGVNSDSFIISKNNKLEITADGKIKVSKVQGKGIKVNGNSYEQKGSALSDEEITINAKNIKLSGTGTEANKKIELNGDVENSASIYTKESLTTKSLINSGDIEAKDKILIDGNLDNSSSIKTAKNLRANNVKNTKEILVTENIDIANLSNDGNISTDSTLKVDGKLSNTGNIKAIDKIDVKENILNKGGILTNNTLTSKDVVTTKKLIAKNGIDIGGLNNSGIVETDKKLNIKGNLTNTKGNIKALEEIKVLENATNTGEILTNGAFTSKDLETTKKLIALKDISVDNLKSDGILLTNQKLTVNGKLENKGKVQAVDNIKIAENVKNEGEVLTEGAFTTKDINTSNKLMVKQDISIGKLENSGTIGTEKELKVNGLLNNSGDIKALGNISVKENVENTGEILSNSAFTAQNVNTSKKLVAIGKISVKDLTNTGEVATNENLKIDGTLTNEGNIKAVKDIDISKNVKNSGDILTNGNFTSKNINTSKKLIVQGNISVDNLENSGIVETNQKLDVNGELVNKGDIQALSNIKVKENVVNDGNLITNGNLKAKNVKTSKKLIATEGIFTNKLENSGLVGTSKALNINGDLKNEGSIESLED
ncbi:MAG: filamentous hemagglutinin N-terminal domain-containing protein, partial [Fusobacterium sp.]|nr:filamentous hemagglutinin N-terminal domain-containing protein [Fusobacterium sp.]